MQRQGACIQGLCWAFSKHHQTTLKDCHDLDNLMLRHDVEGYYCSIALGLRPPTPSSPSMPLITEWTPRKPFSTLCPYPPHPSVPSHHCLLQEACQDNPNLIPFSGLPWHRLQGYFCPSSAVCCSFMLLSSPAGCKFAEGQDLGFAAYAPFLPQSESFTGEVGCQVPPGGKTNQTEKRKAPSLGQATLPPTTQAML